MGQGSNYAVVKDAQINLIEEEFTGDMVQRSNYAAAMDARVLLETGSVYEAWGKEEALQ